MGNWDGYSIRDSDGGGLTALMEIGVCEGMGLAQLSLARG
jgi:hypothetical protein